MNRASSDAYRAAEESVAWINRSTRSRLRVSGPDAAKFLHNLTTNDVKRLSVGRGCEAFVTSPQGKTLGYVMLHARPDFILVRSDPNGLAIALPHLQKYGVFDDVVLDDESATTLEFHIVGPDASGWLTKIGVTEPAGQDLASVVSDFGGRELLCIRESPTGRPGFTLIVAGTDASALEEALRNAGVVELDSETFETLRIEAGTPVYGREVGEKNLPQEIARDSRTISFVKGCYLGQETVARLDALGHVNKILKGLRFSPGDPTPPAGTALGADGKCYGTVAKPAFTPGWGAAVGLGVVRVSHADPGRALIWKRPEDGSEFTASVADPPLIPPRD